MKIINIYGHSLNPFHSALNMRQLLNPIFFSIDQRHPDMKRQHSRRQRSKDLAAARKLKMAYVPLCKVAPPDPPDNSWRDGLFSQPFHAMMRGKIYGEPITYEHLWGDLDRALDSVLGRQV